MTFEDLDAFVAESASAETTLRDVPADAWTRAALGEWNLHELAAHLVGAAARLAEYAEESPGATAPACDRVSYWRFDLAAEAPAIADRARQRAAGIASDEMAGAFHDAWEASAETAATLGADALVMTLRGPMRLGEYLATRVLEVTVHHMDIRTALDLPPIATPEAGRITMAILEGLLGEPRPRNLGRTRFIRVATGREPSDDPRFPVLR